MEFINQSGRHVAIPCARCGLKIYVLAAEMQQNPARPICEDCRSLSPEQKFHEFETALRRSAIDSVAMHARWAAQDARLTAAPEKQS